VPDTGFSHHAVTNLHSAFLPLLRSGHAVNWHEKAGTMLATGNNGEYIRFLANKTPIYPTNEAEHTT